MNKYIQGAFLLVLLSFFYSCSFRKLVAGKKPSIYDWHVVHDSLDSNGMVGIRKPLPQPYSAIANTDSAEMIKLLVDRLTPLWKSRLQFRTFWGKAKMHIEGPDDKEDFTAHIRIRKDSVIWINITALGGISFARILVTTDSFFMVNHIQKTAVCMPLTSAAKVLPAKVDFISLQNLVLGEPLREGVLTDATNFKDSWSLKVEDSSYIQVVQYMKSDSTLHTGQLRTHDPDGPTATTEYSAYEVSDNRKMSTERTLVLKNNNNQYKLEMNFVKFNFDEPMEFQFSIPKNYSVK